MGADRRALPFCRQRHFHCGNDGPEPDLGARVSHCITGDGGTYVLVETEAPRIARGGRVA